MAWQGPSFEFPCGLGGLDSSPKLTGLGPANYRRAEHVTNDNLVLKKRGGIAAYNATAASGTPQIMGFTDFWRAGATQLFPVATGDGKLYKAAGGAITTTYKTGLTASKRTCFLQVFDYVSGKKDKLLSFNGADAVQVWDGVAAGSSDLATPPADWAGANQPKFGLAHEDRVWAWGNPNFPNFAYYCVRNSPENWTGPGSGFFNVRGLEVTAGGELNRRLFLFTGDRTFWVDDEDPAWDNWRLVGLDASGGTRSPFAVVNPPNDLVYIGSDGGIYSLVAVQKFGEVQQGDITARWLRPWLQEHLVTAQLPNAQGLFDPYRRVLYFSVAIDGSPTNNCLIRGVLPPLFTPEEIPIAWFVDPGITASVLGLRRVNGVLRPYYGDYAGKLYALDQTTLNDNGAAYNGRVASGFHDFGRPKLHKLYRSAEIVMSPQGIWSGDFEWFIDGVRKGSRAFTLGGGGGGLLDSFILDVDVLGGIEVVTVTIPLTGKGEHFGWAISQAGLNQGFQIHKVRVNYQEAT